MKEKIPDGVNLANTLMDILYIGKEAVYRRLRGEVPFTLNEASIISKKLDILDFVAEYASYLLGSGVHTSRVIRNAQRIGTSQGVDIQLSSFQKSIIITVHDERSGEVVTRVASVPSLFNEIASILTFSNSGTFV